MSYCFFVGVHSNISKSKKLSKTCLLKIKTWGKQEKMYQGVWQAEGSIAAKNPVKSGQE